MRHWALMQSMCSPASRQPCSLCRNSCGGNKVYGNTGQGWQWGAEISAPMELLAKWHCSNACHYMSPTDFKAELAVPKCAGRYQSWDCCGADVRISIRAGHRFWSGIDKEKCIAQCKQDPAAIYWFSLHLWTQSIIHPHLLHVQDFRDTKDDGRKMYRGNREAWDLKAFWFWDILDFLEHVWTETLQVAESTTSRLGGNVSQCKWRVPTMMELCRQRERWWPLHFATVPETCLWRHTTPEAMHLGRETTNMCQVTMAGCAKMRVAGQWHTMVLPKKEPCNDLRCLGCPTWDA